MQDDKTSAWRRALGQPGIAVGPLRLFLGLTFIWASVDKLRDPQFLDPAAPGYLGQQLALVGADSPLAGVLTALVVPNAALFGALIMGGELLVGLAVLLGWWTRFGAALGLLINLSFYLTITWEVRPFYYGADLVFSVAWLTLLLAGPGPLSVDAYLRRPAGAGRHSALGRGGAAAPGAAARGIDRRRFNILAVGALGAGVLGVLDMAAWPLLHGPTPRPVAQGSAETPTARPPAPPPPAPAAAQPSTTATTAPPPALPPERPPAPAGTAAAAVPYATPGLPPGAAATLTAVPTATPAPPTSTPATGAVVIATPGTLPVNAGLNFTNAQTGDPGVLVHLPTGYVAYRAICTHQGCTVGYTAQQHLIICPCHASLFDPAQGGIPIRGPARRPLTKLPLTVAPDGTVSLAG